MVTPLLQCRERDTVIIGTALADELSVTIGNTVRILYASDQQTHNKKLIFNAHTVTVGGIIKTGYEDIDHRMVLCSFDLFDTFVSRPWRTRASTTIHTRYTGSTTY